MAKKSKTRKCSRCGKRRDHGRFSTSRARVCDLCKKRSRKGYSRETHLADTYGLSLDEYAALLESQDGKCAICKGKRRYNLAVDHCHASAKEAYVRSSVRGLLCKRCNKMLSQVRDDVKILQAAIRYLEDWPAKKVL